MGLFALTESHGVVCKFRSHIDGTMASCKVLDLDCIYDRSSTTCLSLPARRMASRSQIRSCVWSLRSTLSTGTLFRYNPRDSTKRTASACDGDVSWQKQRRTEGLTPSLGQTRGNGKFCQRHAEKFCLLHGMVARVVPQGLHHVLRSDICQVCVK